VSDDQVDHIRERLLRSLELAHERFQRREASAWLVLCMDDESPEDRGPEFVGTYGPFATPEEALVECGKHDASSLDGFKNYVSPLYPPVLWKDELR
jgi:hypothetical protein